MTYEELLKNNKFIKTVLDDNTAMIEAIDQRQKEKKAERGRDVMMEKEKFIVDTFKGLTEVLSKVESLDHYLVFLNSYPKTKLWEKSFGRADYIKYHTECYLNSLIGIFDRCLLLVNFLYDLGLQERDAKYHVIISNKHTKSEPVKRILEVWNKGLQNIRPLRNFVNHEGRFSDKELDRLAMYEFLLRSGAKLTKKQKNVIKMVVIKFGFRSYIREKKKESEKNNQQIKKVADKLFEALLPKYKTRLEIFL